MLIAKETLLTVGGDKERAKSEEYVGVGGYLFVDCLSHYAIDQASLSRRSGGL